MPYVARRKLGGSSAPITNRAMSAKSSTVHHQSACDLREINCGGRKSGRAAEKTRRVAGKMKCQNNDSDSAQPLSSGSMTQIYRTEMLDRHHIKQCRRRHTDCWRAAQIYLTGIHQDLFETCFHAWGTNIFSAVDSGVTQWLTTSAGLTFTIVLPPFRHAPASHRRANLTIS